MSPIEMNLHHDPLGSMLVVFGVDLALPVLMAVAFAIVGRRRSGDERRAYYALAKCALGVCLMMQLLCASYHARWIAGTAETGTVARTEEIASSRYPQCELTLQTTHGELEVDVSLASCRSLRAGTSVPIITVGGSTWFAQVGERATAHVGLTFGLIPLMLLVLLWVLIRTTTRRDG